MLGIKYKKAFLPLSLFLHKLSKEQNQDALVDSLLLPERRIQNRRFLQTHLLNFNMHEPWYLTYSSVIVFIGNNKDMFTFILRNLSLGALMELS